MAETVFDRPSRSRIIHAHPPPKAITHYSHLESKVHALASPTWPTKSKPSSPTIRIKKIYFVLIERLSYACLAYAKQGTTLEKPNHFRWQRQTPAAEDQREQRDSGDRVAGTALTPQLTPRSVHRHFLPPPRQRNLQGPTNTHYIL